MRIKKRHKKEGRFLFVHLMPSCPKYIGTKQLVLNVLKHIFKCVRQDTHYRTLNRVKSILCEN